MLYNKVIKFCDAFRRKKNCNSCQNAFPITLDPDRERERSWEFGLPETLWVGLHVQGIVSIAHTPALPSQRLGCLGFASLLR